MPRSGIPPILALLSLAAGSLRCSDDSGPEEVAECSGPVAVTVTAGAVPSFSWTPRCSLFFLLVEPAERRKEFEFDVGAVALRIVPVHFH